MPSLDELVNRRKDDEVADKTYYAWSPIRHNGENVVKLGDAVSASDLDMDDDEFQYLIDTKVVRSVRYPDDLPAGMAPVEYYRQQAAGTFGDPDAPASDEVVEESEKEANK